MSQDMTGPPRRDEEKKEIAEEASSLWIITLAPLIWAGHFVLSYAAASLICVKFEGGVRAMQLLQWGVGVLTALALAGIVAVAWSAWRQWDFLEDYDYAHDLAREEDRHEFLGHAAFLLSIVSFVGVIYVTMPVYLSGSCQ
jgi:hypothetical protein